MVYVCSIDTPLGEAVAAAEDDAIGGLWFLGQKYYPTRIGGAAEKPELPVFGALRDWLESYFAGDKPPMDIPLAPRGTPFQRSVWDMLLQIPYGQCTTYGAIARRLAAGKGLASMSAQAVGGAVGHNPVSILIPCHRVVGSTGSLTGYAGGLDKKRALLAIEGAAVAGRNPRQGSLFPQGSYS